MIRKPNLIGFPEYTVQCKKLETWIALYLADNFDLSGPTTTCLANIRTALATPIEAPVAAPKAKPSKGNGAKPAPKRVYFDMYEGKEA